MVQGHIPVTTTEPALSRHALVFGLVLLCLDILTKVFFGVLDTQGGPFPMDVTPSVLALVLWPSVPLVLAILWHHQLAMRSSPTTHRFALAALAVGPIGGLFELLYFERTMHLAVPELGLHTFLNARLSGGCTILASLTLLGAAIIGRRAPR